VNKAILRREKERGFSPGWLPASIL